MPEGEWQRALSDPVWGFQRVNKFLDPRHNTPEALAALGLTPEKFAGIGSIKKALHRRAMARWDAADEAAIRRGHEAAKKPPQAKPPESRAVVPERQAVQGTAGVSTALPEGTIDFTAVPEKVKAESEWRALLRARKEADTAREEFDRIAGERNQPDYAGEFSRQDEAEAEKEAGSADKAVEGAEADFLAAEIRVRLEDAGLEVGIDESGLSEARYLEVTDENGENAIRVRLAKHTARPTYQAKFGEADIEISWGAAHPDADIILKGVEDRASLERAVDRIKAKLKLPPTDEVGGVPVEPTKPPPPGPPTEPPPGYTKLPPAAGGLSYEMGPVSPKIPPKPETTGPAQHINLRKYNISDEAADIIVKAGTLSRERLDAARRGKIPLTATDAAAARLAEGDMRWFWNRKPGTPFNDAEITLARDMLASAASAEAEAKQAIRAGDESPAAMERYQRARALTDEIHEITEGASAEIGRALGAHRLMAEVIEKFSDVLDIAERWRRTGKAGKIIRVSDMIYEFWRNVNLLSGLGTDAANILGNTLGLGLRTSGTIVKSIYMKDRYLGEAAIELGALKTYRKQAWEAMKAAWREETPSGKVADLSPFARGGAIPGKFGKIVRAFGYRKLGVEDALFKALLHGSEIEKMAYRQARSEGLGGEALGKRTAEIMAESATKWRRFTRAARAEADYWTYQKSLGPGGAMIVRGLNLLPGVRYITPFKITPVNIAKVTLEHTMLNALRLIYQRSRGQISTEMFAEEMAKPIIGTMIQAGVLLLAANGLITGGGPKDKNRREALYRAGWQPYSARIGNQLFGYNRLEPAGSVMGFAADIFEAAKGEREELLGKLGMSLARNLTSKTFLQAVSGFLDAMQDPERNLKSFIKSEAGSIVPSIVAASARAADPTLRLAPGVGETIRSRIPGVSQGLPPRRDLWGKPIVRTNTPAERFASPVSRSEAKSDPVDEEMIRAGLEGVGLPAKTFSHENEKVELDARQYDQYVQQSGELAYRLVAKAIADPAYANLGEEDKQNLIKGIINAARKLTAVEGVPATEERRQEQVRIEIGKLAALPPMKGKDGTSLFALRQEQAREQRVAADLLAEAGVTPAEARKLYWAHLLKTVKTPQSREWAMQRLTAALRRTAPK